MVAGRVSSSMAAEIGTMRVTEQLDALATLRTDPYRFLIAPRLFASVIALPLLVLIANAIGIFGGYLLAVYKLGFKATSYLEKSEEHTSELQSLMRISYAVFCLKKKNSKYTT